MSHVPTIHRKERQFIAAAGRALSRGATPLHAPLWQLWRHTACAGQGPFLRLRSSTEQAVSGPTRRMGHGTILAS